MNFFADPFEVQKKFGLHFKRVGQFDQRKHGDIDFAAFDLLNIAIINIAIERHFSVSQLFSKS